MQHEFEHRYRTVARFDEVAGKRAQLAEAPRVEALEQLVTDGYSLAYGARFLKRVIEAKIKLPISQRWTEGTAFVADVNDGKVEVTVASAQAGYDALAATA